MVTSYISHGGMRCQPTILDISHGNLKDEKRETRLSLSAQMIEAAAPAFPRYRRRPSAEGRKYVSQANNILLQNYCTY